MPGRKVPLVWKSAKQSDQTLLKYNPATKTVVQVGCGCAVATPPPPPVTSFQYIRVSQSGDPGSGNFAIIPNGLPNVILNISITDKNSQDATTFLSVNISGTLNIKIQKDPNNYVLLTRNSNTDNTTYWSFNCTIVSNVGIVNNGDTVTIASA